MLIDIGIICHWNVMISFKFIKYINLYVNKLEFKMCMKLLLVFDENNKSLKTFNIYFLLE